MPKKSAAPRKAAPKAGSRKAASAAPAVANKAAGKPVAVLKPVSMPKGPPANEREQALVYSAGVEAFGRGAWDKALRLFEQTSLGPDNVLRHRARVHESICRQRLESQTAEPKSPEDLYNYAVGLINDRRLPEAIEHLDRALKRAKNAAYIHYAKSVALALDGAADDALRGLSRAIELDPAQRLIARRDPDLGSLRDDPRFREIVKGDGASA